MFNTVNLHLYHYAGNNPLKYTDPDGNYINSIFSYSKMGDNPWGNNKINSIDKSEMGKYGCAITGMANIFTTALNNREGNGYHTRSLATPVFINKKENFDTNTDNIDWSAVANSMGMKATRSKVGDSDAAIASLLSANMSGKNVSALVQVPITTSQGDSNHWVGVDGNLVDLKNNNELWVKVSPTSTNDNRNRLGNSNWAQGNDGSMYVKVQSITGTVIVE
ncbi:hypothetical protein AGMMS50293_19960 [Spirochaetia bacterium]|nr:hypothetical protein AGMMS50293_19960 [Spirochaetia bacterium]